MSMRPQPSDPSLIIPLVEKSTLGYAPIDWHGLNDDYLIEEELETIIALLRSASHRRVLELGCNNGRTASLILRNVPTVEYYLGVDVFKTHVPTLPYQTAEIPNNPGQHALGEPRFRLLVSSGGSFDLKPADIGPFDVVFIDGDHSFTGVEHDTTLALNVVQPGGLIIWHDYHHYGQEIGVRDFLENRFRAGSDLKHVQGTWLVFERV